VTGMVCTPRVHRSAHPRLTKLPIAFTSSKIYASASNSKWGAWVDQ
jgi:hypothetical protein